jgi:hypothetical protein
MEKFKRFKSLEVYIVKCLIACEEGGETGWDSSVRLVIIHCIEWYPVGPFTSLHPNRALAPLGYRGSLPSG